MLSNYTLFSRSSLYVALQRGLQAEAAAAAAAAAGAPVDADPAAGGGVGVAERTVVCPIAGEEASDEVLRGIAAALVQSSLRVDLVRRELRGTRQAVENLAATLAAYNMVTITALNGDNVPGERANDGTHALHVRVWRCAHSALCSQTRP